eukprot:7184290-Pyramimonas_sp.AAC.1
MSLQALPFVITGLAILCCFGLIWLSASTTSARGAAPFSMTGSAAPSRGNFSSLPRTAPPAPPSTP